MTCTPLYEKLYLLPSEFLTEYCTPYSQVLSHRKSGGFVQQEEYFCPLRECVNVKKPTSYLLIDHGHLPQGASVDYTDSDGCLSASLNCLVERESGPNHSRITSSALTFGTGAPARTI